MRPGIRKLLGIGLLLFGLGLAGYLFIHRPGGRSRPPEVDFERSRRPVVLITMDTTRPDHLQPYGCKNVETPVLESLAEKGIVFEHAVAVAPLTLPAHTSIHTGLLPPHTGVRNNGTHYVEPSLTTLAERFKDHGFKTAAFVSAAVLARRYGLSQGFDVYDDDLSTSAIRAPGVVPDRPGGETVKAARKWLDTIEDGENFFLWVHFYDPHSVYNPPPPYRDTYRSRLYDGEIAYMDSQIGELLAHPRLSGENAPIVLLIGDHGESLGEHGEQSHGILAYDSTLHVPWILDIPGGPEGIRVVGSVSQVDLAPTLLDLEGFGIPEESDGLSLLGTFSTPELLDPRPIYSECYLPYYTYGWAKLKVLRRANLKLIQCPKPELYDLNRDPRELTNLINDQSYQAHDLEVAMKELLGSALEEDRVSEIQVDQEAAQQLIALGYLAVNNVGDQPDAERPIPMEMIDVHVILERARFYSSSHMFEKAEEVLHKLLERDPRNLAALMELASCYSASGDEDKALEVVTHALSLDPDNGNFLYMMANMELRKGNIDKGIEILEKLVDTDPNRADARIRLAQIALRTGDTEKVKEIMNETLKRDPENPQILAAYAQLIDLPEGKIEDAEKHLQTAIDRDPFFEDSWVIMASLYKSQGRFDEAIKMYTEGLKKTPDSATLHGGLGMLLANMERPEEARVHLEEAIRLSNEFQTNYHLTLGALLAEAGRQEEAEEQYNLVLENAPDNPGAKNNQALTLLQKGQINEAEKVLKQLVEEFPYHVDALNNLSAIALMKQQWKTAAEWAGRAIEADEKNIDGWNNLGYAQMMMKSYDEAEQSLMKALEINPGHWQAELNMGTLLMQTGRPKEAEKILAHLASERPGLGDVHYLLGELYIGPLKDPVKARQQFSLALKINPRHPKAIMAKKELMRIPAN